MLGRGDENQHINCRVVFKFFSVAKVPARKMVEALLTGPWEDCLQHLSPLEVSSVTEASRSSRETAGSLGVEWLVGLRGISPLRRVREALDLLALVKRVNTDAWKREVRRLWPKAATLWFGPARQGKAFEIGVIIEIRQTIDSLVEEMVDLEREFVDFVEYRASVEAALCTIAPATDSSRYVWRQPNIPVRLDVGMHDVDDFDVVLLALPQLAVSQCARLKNFRAMSTEFASSRQVAVKVKSAEVLRDSVR